jgi:predicted Zn-dependent peptidase
LSEPEVHIHEYPNGLTLVAERRPQVRAAAFSLMMRAGPVTAPEGQGGISKVLAEMCYRGAGERDSRALSEALDGLGLQRGGGVAGEMASFGGALLADRLGDALQLHADIVRRPALPDSELEPVVALALQDIQALEDAPARKMFVNLRRTYFRNEYGRSSLGDEAALGSLTAKLLRKDRANRYLPGGAILSVAGRFDWSWLQATVEKTFGDWEGAGPAAPDPEYRTAPHYEHIEQETAQEHIGLTYASIPPLHADRYTARMAVSVLSGGMGARLFTEIREKRALVYSVSASPTEVRGHGAIMCYAGTTPERSQETLDVLVQELRRLGEGVEQDELDRARVGLLSSLVMQGESTGARARAITSDYFYLGRVRSLGEIRAGVESVTPGGIVAHLAEYPAKNFTVTSLGPRQLTVPA